MVSVDVNPFTATACKNSRAEMPANSVFSGHITSIFNVSRFHHYPSTRLCNKKKKKKQKKKRLKGLKFRTIIGHFQVTSWQ